MVTGLFLLVDGGTGDVAGAPNDTDDDANDDDDVDNASGADDVAGKVPGAEPPGATTPIGRMVSAIFFGPFLSACCCCCW